MVQVKKHYHLPRALKERARLFAAQRRLTLKALVVDALRVYADGLAMARLTTLNHGERKRPITELPEDVEADLLTLHADADSRLLNVWLALLADVGWSVTVLVAPVLGINKQAISKRVATGSEILASAAAAELLTKLPAVPDIPMSAVRSSKLSRDVTKDSFTFWVDEQLIADVEERAQLEGITVTHAVWRALSDRISHLLAGVGG